MSDKKVKKHTKWDGLEGGSVSNQDYAPSYVKKNTRYSPKRKIRSFRDLEVYQKTMENALVVTGEVVPILVKDKFPMTENMTNCALNIPLLLAQAHGQRFADFDRAVATLESAMQSCNKMVVYLEEAQGLSHNADDGLLDDLMQGYIQVRGKMLRLERSWIKFRK
tara:strand:- start:157 stop:651 length:495 start_codon:yes stop_codon:yes gene_type:complete